MKRFLAVLFLSMISFVIILVWFWTQRDTLLDFASDVERAVSAPVPRSFEEVLEEVKFVETVELEEGVELVENVEIIEAVEVAEDPTPNNSNTQQFNHSNTPSLPTTFNLAIPFTSQAPLANWDATHEDACEEATIYMVRAFFEGWPAGKIDPDQAETDLLKIIEFEKALFGFFESTTATQIAILAEQMYGYERVEVVEDPTIEDLKKYLVAGRPVIVPTAGRQLGNPNFTGQGPLYHAVVLKGYTETTFVTNDPGTRLGADYQYAFDTIMGAMHDWNGGEVENGAKVVVVIYPNSP